MWQVRVDIRARCDGQDYVNTYMYVKGRITGRLDGDFNIGLDPQLPNMTTGDAEGLKILWEEEFKSRYQALCTSDWEAKEIRVYSLSPNPDVRQSWTFPVSWAGSVMPPTVQPGVAAIITRRPNPGQRRYNGRLYYGCFALADCSAGEVVAASATNTALTNMSLSVARILSDPLAPVGPFNDDWTPAVIQHRNFDPLHTTYLFNTFGALKVAVKLQLRSYRRRRPGHGRYG